MNRVDVVQKIIDKLYAKTYLEIGVDSGETFELINVANKIGIDPIPPAAKVIGILGSNTKYFELGSDDFFAHETSILEEGLDVVLIDGLHEYKQVLRDVNNCLKYLNDGGVIVLHDCNPVSEAMALRAFSLSEAKELAKENGLNWTKEWTGDVWKSVVSLRSFRDDLNVFVLDCDYGLGIITKKKPESSLNFSEEDIKKMGYEDLANNRKGLLCLKDSEFFEIFLSEL